MLRSWMIYFVCLVGTALFNRIQPGYISSLLFYVILFIPVVSLVHVAYSHYRFILSHNLSKEIVAKGDVLTYTIKLINPGFLLFVPFSMHYTASDKLFLEAKDDENKPIVVNSKNRVTIRKELTCAYRGTYCVGVDAIYLTDFFGFFKLQYKEIEQHKILVYPKLRELKSNILRNVINESSESVVSNDSQNMSVFTDVRDYQPGDPLNRIHWKLTAKAGSFISKDYSGQMTNNTKVFLDTYNLGLMEEDGIIFEDYLVEGCVSLVHFLLENRINTELFFNRFEIHKVEGNSNNDFPKFYDELAKLSFIHEDHFVETLTDVVKTEKDSSHLIVMTQNVSLPLAETLIKLKYQNYEVSVVVCDTTALEAEGLNKFAEQKTRFLLSTSKIPVYHMLHNENATVLGVS